MAMVPQVQRNPDGGVSGVRPLRRRSIREALRRRATSRRSMRRRWSIG